MGILQVHCAALLLCVTAGAATEPRGYPPKTIQPMNPGECPNDAERYELLTIIQQEIREDLQTLTQMLKGGCGGEGWTRIAYVNMSDPSEVCPTGWNLATYNSGTVRVCRRDAIHTQPQCDSITFPSGNVKYSQVCGRAIGYQIGGPEAFGQFSNSPDETIEGHYMDGLSITHGQVGSRQHIWSFVTGNAEDRVGNYACPCAPNASDILIPSFVGSNYFCESGRVHDTGVPQYSHNFYDDPLWDGQGCSFDGNTCCTFNSPPYFNVHLPTATTDDIEVRLCGRMNLIGTIVDTRINFLEIYIK